MGVGHNTTDEVGLSLVEGGHQIVELALEVGGHGLAALALLPLLVLWSLQGLERERDVSVGKLSKETLKRQVGLMGDYLAGVILEAIDGQLVATVLDHLN